ncbi:hypothetical protein Ancab_022257 [Ancistrocladus abbreviatus]
MKKKKAAALILITIFFIFSPYCSTNVNSQSTDSCNLNINFNDVVPFDTTTLNCKSVWQPQGYILRYAYTGSGVWSFLLSAPDSNSYIAIGFSKNGLMVGSSAMVGWMQDGSGIIKQYYLGGENANAVKPDQGDLKVVSNSSVAFRQSGRIYLAFQLSTYQPSTNLIYAVGPTGFQPTSPGYQLMMHRTMVSTTLNYATGQSQTQGSPYTGIKRAHGAINMLAWGILMPIGIIVARFLKQYDPIWFYAHAGIQTIAFILGLTGVILGFVIYGLLNSNATTHKNLGIFILALGCLQATAILIRPQKGSKVRKYWNWYHLFTGRILIIFAVANIFYGIHLGREGVGWNAAYGIILAILFILAIVLHFTMRRQF